MDPLSDPFDEVLLAIGQQTEGPQERTPEQIEAEERRREHERLLQEHLDEVQALREWRERGELIERVRRQLETAIRQAVPPRPLLAGCRSPVDYPVESSHESPFMTVMRQIFESEILPPDMATAETASDSESDSELELVRTSRRARARAMQRRGSYRSHSPVESSLLATETEETGIDRSAHSVEGSTSNGNSINISELDLNAADVASENDPSDRSDSSLGTVGPMVFHMEMDETVDPQNMDEKMNAESTTDTDNGFRIGEILVWVGPRTLPMGVPGDRNNSERDIGHADMEVLLDDVREFTIGFELDSLPGIVEERIPILIQTARPGSFEHLLLHMFDDPDRLNGFQQVVRELGIRTWLRLHCEQNHGLTPDDSPPEADPSSPGPDAETPGNERNSEYPSIVATFFARELRALRLMVAPLRDPEMSFVWITMRINQPLEMREQFQASKQLIMEFKRRLRKKLFESESWTIRYPNPDSPRREGRQRSLSLHQYRLDASCATTTAGWEQPSPDDNDELQELSDPLEEEWLGIAPEVQVSEDQESEFANVEDIQGYDEELLTLLVRIAQWLALARGHAAVHLFCDIARLFSLSGVDLSDVVQTEFCEHLLRMEVWPEQSGSPNPLPAGVAADSIDSPMFSSVGQGNCRLARGLMEVETLLHRVGDRRRSVGGAAGRET